MNGVRDVCGPLRPAAKAVNCQCAVRSAMIDSDPRGGSSDGSAYERLRSGFDGERPTVTAFPDGSVDAFYELRESASDRRVSKRASFVDALSAGGASFRRRELGREAGGQAVNMARQTAALNADATLLGFLDHPLLSNLPFETISLGEPARVSVYRFDDDALIVAEESAAIERWEPADLEAAAGDRFGALLRADAICCGNWVSFRSLPTLFRDLAARRDAAGVFVFDPGDLTGAATDDLSDLADALSLLDGRYDVVLSANRAEVEYLAETVADEGRGRVSETDEDAATLRALRDALSIAGVVLHERAKAAAATPSGFVCVPNLRTESVERTTGAGDRFSAGVAYALGAGREWDVALALGNACASYYVETGETLSAAALDEYLRERPEAR